MSLITETDFGTPKTESFSWLMQQYAVCVAAEPVPVAHVHCATIAAVQRIGSDNCASQIKQSNNLESRLDLIVSSAGDSREAQPGLNRKGRNSQRWRGLAPALIGTAQRFVIDSRHTSRRVTPQFGQDFAKAIGKAGKSLHEGGRLKQAQKSGEPIMAGRMCMPDQPR